MPGSKALLPARSIGSLPLALAGGRENFTRNIPKIDLGDVSKRPLQQPEPEPEAVGFAGAYKPPPNTGKVKLAPAPALAAAPAAASLRAPALGGAALAPASGGFSGFGGGAPGGLKLDISLAAGKAISPATPNAFGGKTKNKCSPGLSLQIGGTEGAEKADGPATGGFGTGGFSGLVNAAANLAATSDKTPDAPDGGPMTLKFGDKPAAAASGSPGGAFSLKPKDPAAAVAPAVQKSLFGGAPSASSPATKSAFGDIGGETAFGASPASSAAASKSAFGSFGSAPSSSYTRNPHHNLILGDASDILLWFQAAELPAVLVVALARSDLRRPRRRQRPAVLGALPGQLPPLVPLGAQRLHPLRRPGSAAGWLLQRRRQHLRLARAAASAARLLPRWRPRKLARSQRLSSRCLFEAALSSLVSVACWSHSRSHLSYTGRRFEVLRKSRSKRERAREDR